MDGGLDKRGFLSISKVGTQVRTRVLQSCNLNIYRKFAVMGCRQRNQAFRTVVLSMKVEHLNSRHLETSKLKNINI